MNLGEENNPIIELQVVDFKLKAEKLYHSISLKLFIHLEKIQNY